MKMTAILAGLVLASSLAFAGLAHAAALPGSYSGFTVNDPMHNVISLDVLAGDSLVSLPLTRDVAMLGLCLSMLPGGDESQGGEPAPAPKEDSGGTDTGNAGGGDDSQNGAGAEVQAFAGCIA